MLMGEYQHNMDVKGRVTMPSKFKDALGDKFIVCKGLDSCLFVMPEKNFQTMIEKVDGPMGETTDIKRYFLSGASEVEPDKQGRILIPTNLREFSNLEKEVTITGVGDHAEIWRTERWSAYQNETQQEAQVKTKMIEMKI